MKVLNFGSINIDVVYTVPHLVRPGETLAASAVHRFAGGKGANQSVALARAGATVFHGGRVGPDGQWLLDELRAAGVDLAHVVVDPHVPTGSAFIQVAARGGENAIVLDGGANRAISREQIDRTLAAFSPGDVLLLQNETNALPDLIAQGHRRGLRIVFNPAPAHAATLAYGLEAVDLLIANAGEAEALTGLADPAAALHRLPGREKVITLGKDGAIYAGPGGVLRVGAPRVVPVDTTAAGDTFIGYLIARQLAGDSAERALTTACAAASLCATRPGAMRSIPRWQEVGVN